MAKTLTIGVSGDVGSFSEEAALLYCEQKALRPKLEFLIDMEGVLAAVSAGTVGMGIFPVVNIRGGLVKMAFEAMGRYPFTLVDDLWLEVQQCLMARPGTKVSEITQITSHPQALAQCASYLKSEFPKATQTVWEDTAKAAKDLAAGKLPASCAVLAPARSAEVYGLELLARNVQDMKPNLTAFIIVKQKGSL